jgi:hypothetical protein
MQTNFRSSNVFNVRPDAIRVASAARPGCDYTRIMVEASITPLMHRARFTIGV